jgi:hypothetical protein
LGFPPREVNPNEKKPLEIGQIDFTNFNEKEETTCITSLTMLQFSCCKTYLLLPILSLLSLFILPVRMYWSVPLQRKYMYSEVTDLARATHLLVYGRDGNIEIVELTNMAEKMKDLVSDSFIQIESLLVC